MKQNNPFDFVTQEAPRALEQGTGNKTNTLICCYTRSPESGAEVRGQVLDTLHLAGHREGFRESTF